MDLSESPYLSPGDGRYLLVEKSGQVMLIDFYLAREYITRVSIKNNITGNKLVTRPLLVPVTINLSTSDMKLAGDHRQLLKRVGIVMEPAGPESLRIREIPSLLAQADILPLIKDVLNILAESRQCECQELLINSMASHVNDGMCQSPRPEEVRDLLSGLELLESELKPEEYKKILRLVDNQTIRRILDA